MFHILPRFQPRVLFLKVVLLLTSWWYLVLFCLHPLHDKFLFPFHYRIHFISCNIDWSLILNDLYNVSLSSSVVYRFEYFYSRWVRSWHCLEKEGMGFLVQRFQSSNGLYFMRYFFWKVKSWIYISLSFNVEEVIGID